MTVLVAAWRYVIDNPALFRGALLTHLELSGLALALALVVAVPAGIVAAHSARMALVAVNAANVARTLPSLAVLALMLPLLGIGFLPALVALTILGIPAVLTNTCVGIREVDRDAVESARGMGMTWLDLLRRIELPLAAPAILAGARTAAVQIVASATLAAFIGAGGLGDFITTGIGMMQVELLLVGAVPVTLLAIGTELAFGRVERALAPRGRETVA
jgi:osmoprotectant transport system permease protein